MRFEDSDLIIISNAEPYVHNREGDEIVCENLAGGLTSALDSLIQKTGGVWIAWGRGDADFEVVDSNGKIRMPEGEESFELKRIDLSEKEIENFYLGFSNEVLWPICHSFPEKAALEDYYSSEEMWETYKKVNQRYADAAIEEIEGGEFIWVHDYHLTLVPGMIKKECPNSNIAFFWHIPWPPWEMFGNIPWRTDIMDGMLNSDFIGFHTVSLKENFLYCAKRIGRDVNEENSTVSDGDNTAKVDFIPLGVDFDKFDSLASSESNKKKARELRENISSRNIILGVDRLDYTKGIPQRLRAFELFLEQNPEFLGEVTLVQRIPPSRISADEYQSILRRINRVIGEINGKFEEAKWTPIKSFHRFLPDQEDLIPYYLAADVALVTPLVDGMNLVSKEWIATADDGVLILSEFAGAAEELTEALSVNPHNTRQVAQSIKEALTMPKEERKERLKRLKERVKERDLEWWREEFVKRWLKVYENDSEV